MRRNAFARAFKDATIPPDGKYAHSRVHPVIVELWASAVDLCGRGSAASDNQGEPVSTYLTPPPHNSHAFRRAIVEPPSRLGSERLSLR